MATRYPLIIDSTTNNKIKELPSGDDLNLSGSSIVNVINATASGTVTANAVEVTSNTFSVAGNSLNQVAFTGNYNDLSNAPTVFNGNYDNLTNKPTLKTTIESLDNVSTTAPADNQVLQYDSSSSTYKPSSIVSVSSSSIDALLDVNVSNIASAAGQILKWDGSAWIRGNASSGSDADTLDSYEGTYYLNANNFTNYKVITSVAGDTGSFTTSTSSDTVNIQGGTGISTAITSNTLTITNDLPDQTVAFTNGTNITVTGTYPNFTIATDAVTATLSTISVASNSSPSGSGSIAFNQSTGAITFTPPDLSSYLTSVGVLSSHTDVDTTAPTSGQVLKWNGTAWAPAADGGGGGGGGSGDIEAVTAGTGLTGGGTVGSVTLNVDVGTTANKIVQLDTNAKLPAIDGSQLTNIGTANSIGQLNTNVTVTDTGTDGTITFDTDGTDRWQITSSGHVIPQADASYDIGSASNKIRHIFISDNSIKFGAAELPMTVTASRLHFNSAKLMVDVIDDTSPQLGGNLDVNGFEIVSTGGGHILLDPDTTGGVGIGNVTNPSSLLHLQESAPILTLQRTNNALSQGISWTGQAGTEAAHIKLDGTGGITNTLIMSTFDGSNVTERLRLMAASGTGIKVTGSTDTTKIISSGTNENISIEPNGTGKVLIDGDGSAGGVSVSDGLIEVRTGTGSVGAIDFYCEVNNAHKVTLKAPAHGNYSGDVNFTLPPSNGTSGELLRTDGAGNTSWVTISAGDATLAGQQTFSGDKTFSGKVIGSITDNSATGSFDLNNGNNFKLTPTGATTIDFTNMTAGQSGNIYLDNSGGHTISKDSTIKMLASQLNTISNTGIYWLSYYCIDGTNVVLTASGQLT